MDFQKIEPAGTPVNAKGLDQKIRSKIIEHTIFSGLNEEDIFLVLPFFKLTVLQPNEFITKEGISISKELYIILEGNLEVIKAIKENSHTVFVQHTDKVFTIAHLKSGDLLGELSFIKDVPRSATIRSLTESVVLSLNPAHLVEMRDKYPKITSIMMQNLLGYVSERLKATSDNEVKALTNRLEESERNAKSNIFFSYIIGLLCVYNLAIHLISKWSTTPAMTSIVSAGIILVFLSGCLLIIKHSRLPLCLFGFTLKDWKLSLRESLLWTFVIMTLMLFAKWVLITFIPNLQGQPLIHFQPLEQKYLTFNFILYGLHSPIQEFIARGVLQGSLQHFFVGKNITVKAIVISNALFAATHVHLFGGLLAVVVFITGLFWGWLYSRHQNLLGVSISHILIGWWGLFVLSFDSLL